MRLFPYSWELQQPEQEVWEHLKGKQLENQQFHSSAVLQGLNLSAGYFHTPDSAEGAEGKMFLAVATGILLQQVPR